MSLELRIYDDIEPEVALYHLRTAESHLEAVKAAMNGRVCVLMGVAEGEPGVTTNVGGSGAARMQEALGDMGRHIDFDIEEGA